MSLNMHLFILYLIFKSGQPLLPFVTCDLVNHCLQTGREDPRSTLPSSLAPLDSMQIFFSQHQRIGQAQGALKAHFRSVFETQTWKKFLYSTHALKAPASTESVVTATWADMD